MRLVQEHLLATIYSLLIMLTGRKDGQTVDENLSAQEK
jgi:hypothetical protein